MNKTVVSQNNRFSSRLHDLHPSPIREILSVIDRPGMISFAGGLPAIESFPHLHLEGMPQSMLQYGASEGESELRERIAQNLCGRGLSCSQEQVLIISGSQQGIDLVAKLFIDAGTPVAVESPTYLAALQVFRFFGAQFVAYDSAQPDINKLKIEKPAFAYSIPTFQNPSGHCLSLNQRTTLAKVCDELMLPLFEDDPYSDLVYDPCERKPVCALLQHASWIYQGSFSKSLSPGFRLGYLVASPELIPYLTRLKQAADLHSSRISQWLVLQQLGDPNYSSQMSALAAYYKKRRDSFEISLQRYFGSLASWDKPAGGLFFWLKLNRCIDTRELLPKALESNIAFMPGEPFFPHSSTGCGQLRLNFSHATAEQADIGLQKLANLVREYS
ncbi:aminotransferase [Yersinia frederiksenii]|nr:PLP-dependent aminotransferase family protein [Yersinia vastinensis]CNK10132.1 aminotransferase [Yersinia frederiksenii]